MDKRTRTWQRTLREEAVGVSSRLQALTMNMASWLGALFLQLVLRLWRFLNPWIASQQETEATKTTEVSSKDGDAGHELEIQEPCSLRCRGLRRRAFGRTPDILSQSEPISAALHRDQLRSSPLHSPWTYGAQPGQDRSSPLGLDCGQPVPCVEPTEALPTSSLSPRASGPAPGCCGGKPNGDSSQSVTVPPTPSLAPTPGTGTLANKQGGGTGLTELLNAASGGADVAGACLPLDTACRPDNTSSAYDTARSLVNQAWGQSYTPMFTLGRVALKIPDRHPSDLPPLSAWTRPYCEALEAEGIALVGAYVRQGCIHIILDFLDLAIGGGGSSGIHSGDGGGGGADTNSGFGVPHSNPHALRHGRHLMVVERSERTCSSGGSSRSNSRSNSRRRSGRVAAADLSETDAGAYSGGGGATPISASAAAAARIHPPGGRASAPGEFLHTAAAAGAMGGREPRMLPQHMQLVRRHPPTRVRSANATATVDPAAYMPASPSPGSSQFGTADGDGGDGDDDDDDDNDDDGSVGGATAARNRLRPLSARRLRQLRRASVPSLLSGTPGFPTLPGVLPRPPSARAAAWSATAAAAAAAAATTNTGTSRDGASATPSPAPSPAGTSRLLASLTPELLVELLGPGINGSGQTVTVQLPAGGGDWNVQILQNGGGGAAVGPTVVGPQPPDLKCVSPPCILAGAQGPVSLYVVGTDIQGVASGPVPAVGPDGTTAPAPGGGEAPLTVHVRFRGEFQSCRASLLGDQVPAEAQCQALPLDALRRAEVLCLQLAAPPRQPGLIFVECQRGGLLGSALPVLVAPNTGVWQEIAALQNAALQEGGPQMTAAQRLMTDLGLWLDFVASGLPCPPRAPLLSGRTRQQQQQQLPSPPSGPVVPQNQRSATGPFAPRSQQQQQVLPPTLSQAGYVASTAQGTRGGDDDLGQTRGVCAVEGAAAAAVALAEGSGAPARAAARDRAPRVPGDGNGFALTRLLGQSFLQLLSDAEPPEADGDAEAAQALLPPQPTAVREVQEQQEQEAQQVAPGLPLLQQMVELAERQQRRQQHQQRRRRRSQGHLAESELQPEGSGHGLGLEGDGVGALAAAQMGVAYGSSPGPEATREGDGDAAAAAEAVALGEYVRAISDPQSRRMEEEMASSPGSASDLGLLEWGQMPPRPQRRLTTRLGLPAAPSRATVAPPPPPPPSSSSSSQRPQQEEEELQQQQQEQQQQQRSGSTGTGGGSGPTVRSWAERDGGLVSSAGQSAAFGAAVDTSPTSGTSGTSHTSVCGLSLGAAPPPPHADSVYNGRWQLPSAQPSPTAKSGGVPNLNNSNTLIAPLPVAGEGAVEASEVAGSNPVVSGDLLALGPSEAATLSLALMAFGPFTWSSVGAASGNMNLAPVRTDSSGTELHSWDSLTEAALAVSTSLPPASSGALPTTPLSSSTAAPSASPSPRASLHLNGAGDGPRTLRPFAAALSAHAGGGGVGAAAMSLGRRYSEEREGRPQLRRGLRQINTGVDLGQPSPSPVAAGGSAHTGAQAGRADTATESQRLDSPRESTANSPQPATPVAMTGTAATAATAAAATAAAESTAGSSCSGAPPHVAAPQGLCAWAQLQLGCVQAAAAPSCGAPAKEDAAAAPPSGPPATDEAAAATPEEGSKVPDAAVVAATGGVVDPTSGGRTADGACTNASACTAAPLASARTGTLEETAAGAAATASAPRTTLATASALSPSPAAASRPQRAVTDGTAAAAAAVPMPHGSWITSGDEAAAVLHARMRHLGVGLLAFSVRRGWIATTAELLSGLARMGTGLAEAEAAVAAREGGMGLLHLAVTAQQPALLRALADMAAPQPPAGERAASGAAATSLRAGLCCCGGVCWLCSGAGGFPWDVTARGPLGLTPLHLSTALEDGGATAAVLLETFPAAPAAWFTAVDDSGSTPAEMAAQARLGLVNELARARLAARQHQLQHPSLADPRRPTHAPQQLERVHQQPQHQLLQLQGERFADIQQRQQQRQGQIPTPTPTPTPTPSQTQSQVLPNYDVMSALQGLTFAEQQQQVLEGQPVVVLAGPRHPFVTRLPGVADECRYGGPGAAGSAADVSGTGGAKGGVSCLASGSHHDGPTRAAEDGPVPDGQETERQQGDQKAQQQKAQHSGVSWLRTSLRGFTDPRVEARYRMYHAASLGMVDRTCGLVFTFLFLLPALELVRQRLALELLSHCVFNAGLLGPYLLHAFAPGLFHRHRDEALLMGDVIKAFLVVLAVAGAVPLPRVWADFSRNHMDVIMMVVMKPLSEQIRVRAALLQRAAAVVSDAHIYAAVLYSGAFVPSLARALLQNVAALALLTLLDVRSRARFQAAAAATAAAGAAGALYCKVAAAAASNGATGGGGKRVPADGWAAGAKTWG